MGNKHEITEAAEVSRRQVSTSLASAVAGPGKMLSWRDPAQPGPSEVGVADSF